MRDSAKANMIVFFIIAIISFGVSSALVSVTVPEENDSYKLITIENDSFEPHLIDEVPTILPQVVNNTTSTNNTTNKTVNSTIEYKNYTYNQSIIEYVEYR